MGRSSWNSKIAGHRAKQAGDAFESTIELILTGYERTRRATINKVDPPTKVVGKGKVIHMANPFLDYVGAWTERGGRAIFLEAKSTAGPTLKLCASGGLTDKQWEALHRWDQAGAVTGILWGHAGQIKAINLPTIRQAITTRRSIKWEHYRPCRKGTGLITHDFLAELAELT